MTTWKLSVFIIFALLGLRSVKINELIKLIYCMNVFAAIYNNTVLFINNANHILYFLTATPALGSFASLIPNLDQDSNDVGRLQGLFTFVLKHQNSFYDKYLCAYQIFFTIRLMVTNIPIFCLYLFSYEFTISKHCHIVLYNNWTTASLVV